MSPKFRQELIRGDWRLDGLTIGELSDPVALSDRTLRLNHPGLLGGMPPKQNDYHQMSLAE